MKRGVRVSISLITVVSLLILTLSSTFASTAGVINSVEQMPAKGNYYITLDQKSEEYLKTLTSSGVMSEVSTDTNGIMLLKQSDEYLKSKYNLDTEFIRIFKASINDLNTRKKNHVIYQQNSNIATSSSAGNVTPFIEVKDWKLYFTQSEVAAFFSAAATAGPAALMIALDAVMTMIGGPAGTVLSVILDIVGAASITNLCYLILQSAYTGKGVYIGIDWNGPFPNYTQGLW